MDRHARATRARADIRRRPTDGFRLADRARFQRLALMVVRGFSGRVGHAMATTELVVTDVPDPARPTALVEFQTRTGGRSTLTLYRRPLELRAESKPELVQLLRETVHAEVSDVLGLDGGG